MSYTDIADRTTVEHPSAGSSNPRGWTFAGIAAGIAGITGIAASMSIDARCTTRREMVALSRGWC